MTEHTADLAAYRPGDEFPNVGYVRKLKGGEVSREAIERYRKIMAEAHDRKIDRLTNANNTEGE